jgi:sugar lactone lactonase YvrE
MAFHRKPKHKTLVLIPARRNAILPLEIQELPVTTARINLNRSASAATVRQAAMKKFLPPLLALALGSAQLSAQPIITTQPTNQTVLVGANATLSVAVSGTGPFTYQWQFNGTNLLNNVITTVAGNGTNGFSGDGGAATNAKIAIPTGVTVDVNGNLFIADSGNNRIRKVDTNGIITTVAGNGTIGYSGDGGAATNAKIAKAFGVAMDVNGNLFIADSGNNRIRKVDTNGIITTVAGKGPNYPSVGSFSGDGGLATNANLFASSGIAVDANGNLIIADSSNNRLRKVDTNGIITTVAGTNSVGFSGDGGLATNARLNSPDGVALNAAGNLFIADYSNSRIRKVDTNGIIATVAGQIFSGFTGDGGAATNAALNKPPSVAMDIAGYLFIDDEGNNRVRQVDTNGIITTVAGNGANGYSGDGGVATNAKVVPNGVAIDNSINLFIADGFNSIRKVALDRSPMLALSKVTTNSTGNYDVIITSPSGSVTSSIVTLTVGVPASLSTQPQSLIVTNGNPATIALTAYGTGTLIYQWYFNATTMVDGGTNASLNFDNASVNQMGGYFCVVSNDYGSVTSSIATLTVVVPPSIAVQPTNQVVINGSNTTFGVMVSGTEPFAYQWQCNGTNLPVNNIITTVAGNGTNGFSGDGGSATNAKISSSYGMAIDVSGNLFIADSGNHRVRKVDTNSVITTFAGSGSSTFSGDGGAATNAGLVSSTAVVLDVSTNVFITDAFRIRKVNSNGIITTIAGQNSAGNSGDGGAATNAYLSSGGLAVDHYGNLLIADHYGTRKIDTNGIISTLAVLSSFDVAVDVANNLFVSDGATRVRKVDTNGIITIVAGTGSGFSYNGDGFAATNANLFIPSGVAVDIFGNLFIADTDDSRIRKVSPNGIITTVAGNGGIGPINDGGIATNANLNFPGGVAVDAAGNLFIADTSNNRVRKVNLAGSPTLTLNTVTTNRALLSASPPANSVFLTLNGINAGNFSVIITSPYGSVTSSIVTLSVVFLPSITTQPYSMVVTNGGTANFSVTAAGTGPLAYQWYFTNTTVDGGTNSFLQINNASSGQIGNYFCVVTNIYGSVTSSVVALNVQLLPITAVFTASNGVCNFTWGAVSNLTYQLQYNLDLTSTNWIDLGSPVTATSNSISIPDATGPDAQRFYRVRLVQ